MIRRNIIKWLAAILVVLAILWIVNVLIITPQKEKKFKSLLAGTDTSKITKIEIFSRKERDVVITLTREAGVWMVSNGKIKVMADQGGVQGILGDHATIKVDQLAGTSPDHFHEFDVDDSNGTRVKLYEGNKLVLDVVVGKFKFSPQTRRAQSFIRLYDDDKVYAIDGYMALWYNQKFDDYRNRKLFEGDKHTWDSLKFEYASGESFLLYKDTSTSKWLIKGYEEKTDSEKVEQYLTNLWGIRSSSYLDTNIDVASLKPDYSLTIYSRTREMWKLNCYVVKHDTSEIYAIMSSIDNTNIFNGKAGDELFNKMFKNMNDFLKEEKQDKEGKKKKA